jgi:hypothetical protein
LLYFVLFCFILFACISLANAYAESDGITPQQRMIQEIEEYEIRFSDPSLLITQERAKFVRQWGEREKKGMWEQRRITEEESGEGEEGERFTNMENENS